MNTEFERNLEKYAELCIKVGINLQAGQRLALGYTYLGISGVPIQTAPLVRALAKQAYLAGAAYVNVLWEDQYIEHIRLKYGSEDSLQQYPEWRVKTLTEYQENGDAVLGILAQKANMFSDIAPERLQTTARVESQYVAPFLRNTARAINPRCVISAATQEWASLIFPDDDPTLGEAKLWDLIFKICRVTTENPVESWQQHIQQLETRAAAMNERRYTKLHYHSAETELLVGLPVDHIWMCAAKQLSNGIIYVQNIPTEEIFTLPHKEQINGTVTSTKPLTIGGTLVQKFSLTFKDGRVVDASAESGESALRSYLDTDEGARSLGEVALVPHSSPISQSGLLFYNALYDENASSHLALGNALAFTLKNGTTMSDQEFTSLGGNKSRIHLDFMMGSADMNIDGIKADGTVEPVMRQGEWAFDV